MQSHPIETDEMTVRANNILRENNIKTYEQLIALSSNDLKKLRCCGRKTINEIRKHLTERGLALKAEPDLLNSVQSIEAKLVRIKNDISYIFNDLNIINIKLEELIKLNEKGK